MFDVAVSHATGWLARVAQLNARYRAGEMHASVPAGLHDGDSPLEELIARHLPASQVQ